MKAILQRKDLKAKDIKMSVRSDDDENAKKALLVLDKASGTCIVNGTLRYPITINEGEGEDPIDWEITYDAPHRYLVLTMRKKSLQSRDRLLVERGVRGDAEIDVEAIPDRRENKASETSKARPHICRQLG